MAQNLEALKKSESTAGGISSNPSLSNLYNSTSQKGSNTTLNMSNSAVFNNGTGFVQKGTITHINNTSNLNPHNTEDNHHHDDDDEEEDGGFELNWKPQVSSDNYTSGYHDRV